MKDQTEFIKDCILLRGNRKKDKPVDSGRSVKDLFKFFEDIGGIVLCSTRDKIGPIGSKPPVKFTINSLNYKKRLLTQKRSAS